MKILFKHVLVAVLCVLGYGSSKALSFFNLPVAINTKEVANVALVLTFLQQIKLTPAQLKAAALAGQSKKVAVSSLPHIKVSKETDKPVVVFASDKTGKLTLGMDVVIKGLKENVVFSAKNSVKASIIFDPLLFDSLDAQQLRKAYVGLEKRKGFSVLVERAKKARSLPDDGEYTKILDDITMEIIEETFPMADDEDEQGICEDESGNVVRCSP